MFDQFSRPTTGGLFVRLPFDRSIFYLRGDERVAFYTFPDDDGSCYFLGSVCLGSWSVMSWDERQEFAMSYLRKPEVPASNGDGPCPAVSSQFARLYPALTEYMTATKGPDGRDRQVSTVMLVVDPDGVKACLNERQTGHQLWVTCDSVEEAFGALEAALTAHRVNWRVSKYQQGQNRKK